MPFGRGTAPFPPEDLLGWQGCGGAKGAQGGRTWTGLGWNGFPEEAGFKLGQLGQALSEAARTQAQPWPHAELLLFLLPPHPQDGQPLTRSCHARLWAELSGA